jgi:hypothetical protein
MATAAAVVGTAAAAAAPQHLHLELSEGFQLMLDGGDDLLALGQLRSLTLSGGTFAPSAAEALLRALAAACPGLEELRLLPEARCGIGDAEVALLGRLRCLRVRSAHTPLQHTQMRLMRDCAWRPPPCVQRVTVFHHPL